MFASLGKAGPVQHIASEVLLPAVRSNGLRCPWRLLNQSKHLTAVTDNPLFRTACLLRVQVSCFTGFTTTCDAG